MTREEAIKKHRELWHWIANEHRRRKRCDVFKEENPDVAPKRPVNDCWLCEYARQFKEVYHDCRDGCPINWGVETCMRIGSPYRKWVCSSDLNYEVLAYLADVIAELPEKENT